MARDFSASIEGLDELREHLSGKRVRKSLSAALTFYTKTLVQSLETELTRTYHFTAADFHRSWVNRDDFITGGGKYRAASTGILQADLEFLYTGVDLSKFPYSWYWGNINFPAKRKGRVHQGKVKKAVAPGIYYGHNHFGGFVPAGYESPFGYGTQMFERDEPGRDSPLHVLYGPTVAGSLSVLYDNNIGLVGVAKRDIASFIAEKLDF